MWRVARARFLSPLMPWVARIEKVWAELVALGRDRRQISDQAERTCAGSGPSTYFRPYFSKSAHTFGWTSDEQRSFEVLDAFVAAGGRNALLASETAMAWMRRAFAASFAALGVKRGDTVGIMLTNRPEFHLVDAAALHLGAQEFEQAALALARPRAGARAAEPHEGIGDVDRLLLTAPERGAEHLKTLARVSRALRPKCWSRPR